MSEVNTTYSAYVHIENSGFEIKVVVEPYGAQFLTTSLHAFGMPHETRMWLDDNVLDALEYIVAKAREQRKAFPDLTNQSWSPTQKAIPLYVRESGESGKTDSPGEQAVS